MLGCCVEVGKVLAKRDKGASGLWRDMYIISEFVILQIRQVRLRRGEGLIQGHAGWQKLDSVL